VQTGARVGDDVQIISGLRRGDSVAATGGYLIDSEAQLRGGGQSMPGMKMEEKGAAAGRQGQAPAAPATPEKKNDMDMSDMKMQ